jgi:hypothetical protein
VGRKDNPAEKEIDASVQQTAEREAEEEGEGEDAATQKETTAMVHPAAAAAASVLEVEEDSPRRRTSSLLTRVLGFDFNAVLYRLVVAPVDGSDGERSTGGGGRGEPSSATTTTPRSDDGPSLQQLRDDIAFFQAKIEWCDRTMVQKRAAYATLLRARSAAQIEAEDSRERKQVLSCQLVQVLDESRLRQTKRMKALFEEIDEMI